MMNLPSEREFGERLKPPWPMIAGLLGWYAFYSSLSSSAKGFFMERRVSRGLVPWDGGRWGQE